MDLKNYNVMVGYNNAGKSNVLNALSWLIKGARFSEDSFHDTNQAVWVEGVITGVDQTLLDGLFQPHATALQNYIKNEEIRIKRIQSGLAENHKLQVLMTYDDGREEWKVNPTGIDAGISVLFPEPIFIRAMEDAAEDSSKFKASTTIGKLLTAIFATIQEAHAESIREAFRPFKELFSATGANRITELSTFDQYVSDIIESFFPGLRIKAEIPNIEFKEVLKSATITTYEGDSEPGREIKQLGHGAQRAIQMGLIKYLADQNRHRNNQRNTTMLLVEEPELFLHPQAIDIVRESLRQLSESGFQVMISTHSPRLVTKGDIRSTMIITKESGATKMRKTILSAVQEIETNAAKQLDLMFQLTNSSNILFADKIILVEGDTEYWILDKMFEAVKGLPLRHYKTAIVKLHGGGDIKKAMRIMEIMDIPCKAIADLDFAFKAGVRLGYIDKTNSDYIACKNTMANLAGFNAHGIVLDNEWPKNSDSCSAEKAFELLGAEAVVKHNITNLHELYKQHSIWIWKRGSIETYTGVSSKNPQNWDRFLETLENGTASAVITHYDEVVECFTWLIE